MTIQGLVYRPLHLLDIGWAKALTSLEALSRLPAEIAGMRMWIRLLAADTPRSLGPYASGELPVASSVCGLGCGEFPVGPQAEEDHQESGD